MTEDEVRAGYERAKNRPGCTFFNNFHGLFPGGYHRAMSADAIFLYLIGDRRIDKEDVAYASRSLKLWALMDQKLADLGYDLSELRRDGQLQRIEEKHLDMMITMFAYLTTKGYSYSYLVG